jgi:hypothetical protein
MARKPTKKEARDRLASLPNFKKPTKVTALPPPLRPIATIPYVFDQGGKLIARLLIAADPLNRIDNSRANRIDAGEVFDNDIVQQQAIINDPNIIMDEIGNVLELIEPLRDAGGFALPSKANVKKAQKVTKKMKMQRKIQSKAFANANAKGRLLNGNFRAGFDQSRIARMAQKECTSERIRLGLCEDPKKKKGRKSRK